jgi:hypothetical protein
MTFSAVLEQDAEEVCGPRHARGEGRGGHRWGRTRGKIGFHGGKIELERPRVRNFDGQELPLPSWERASEEDWLGRWAMNLMLMNVSTRKFRRAVRLPEGDVPAPQGAGVSKSATSRRFVALSAARMKEWMASDLGHLDIMVVQIDCIHIAEDIVLVAAIGIDGEGAKHPLGLIEGASEHSAVVQALIDNLIERGLDPAVPRLFIIDGSKALSKAIRRSFGRHTPIQRCQIHKARNIMERLPKPLHASVRRGAAPGLGTGRCRQGRDIDPQSCATPRTRCARRLHQHPGGLGRDSHGDPSRIAGRTSTLARLHQHHRERHGHGAQGLPQRETLAINLDGAALDSCGHERSIEGLPQAEGSQAIANLASCAHRPSRENIKQRRSCERSEGRVT